MPNELLSMPPAALRARAEQLLRQEPSRHPPRENAAGWDSSSTLIHELELHQVELQLQCEELRNAHEWMSHARDRYRDLFELAPVAYLVLDEAGTIVTANQATAALLGRSGDELCGTPIYAQLDSPQADTLYRHYMEVFEGEESACCDVDFRAATAQKPVRVRSVRIGGAARGGKRCHSALVDLSPLKAAETARSQAEAARESSDRHFRLMAGHLHDALLLFDRTSRAVIYASPSVERIWGRSTRELLGPGATWLNWTHAEDLERVAQAQDSVRRGAHLQVRYRIYRPDGEVRWVRVTASPYLDELDNPAGHVVVAQDVTEEHVLEDQLQQAQKLEALGAFTSSIAHDFNNVLQAILGFSHAARSASHSPGEVNKHLAQLARVARGSAGLVARLLAFARPRCFEPGPLVVDGALAGLRETLQRLVTGAIQLEIQTNAPEAAISADPVRFDQVVINLVANARDAMPNGGRLLLRTDRKEPEATTGQRAELRLLVADSGVGMDASTREHIFAPFFTTKEPGSGTGLGLATVSAAVREMDGRIEVLSDSGKGTRFILHFPLCNEERRATASSESAAGVAPGTVLLVEDDKDVRWGMADSLRRAGLKVLEAADVDQAINEHGAELHALDLLICDMNLPGSSAASFGEQLRRSNPRLGVLWVSANTERLPQEAPAERVLSLGKPFVENELLSKLAELSKAASSNAARSRRRERA